MSSPRWLFLAPGLALVLAGLLGYALALPGLHVLGAHLDAHTLLIASLAILLGQQSITFAILARTYGMEHGYLPEDPRLRRFLRNFTVERGLAVALMFVATGLVLLASAVARWMATGFGDLDYPSTMRRVIPGMMLTAFGFHTGLYAFLSSIMRLNREGEG
jgi:hypothetical protein